MCVWWYHAGTGLGCISLRYWPMPYQPAVLKCVWWYHAGTGLCGTEIAYGGTRPTAYAPILAGSR
eukprot:1381089-Rhodomonas_salina.2